MRVEESSVPKHGAGDVDEAIGDLSEGSSVAVSPWFALGLGDGVALGCDACPVVCGIGEALFLGTHRPLQPVAAAAANRHSPAAASPRRPARRGRRSGSRAMRSRAARTSMTFSTRAAPRL